MGFESGKLYSLADILGLPKPGEDMEEWCEKHRCQDCKQKDRIIAALVEQMVHDMHDEYDRTDAGQNAAREAKYRAEIAAIIAAAKEQP